ncbi:hypothetical protein CNE_BB1p06700 (plasmid) [Cupriavidus necator N-1]|uniref:Uncharacterized protein n=1 Tax=Cupriavidus necator (strain ATCC 43291 / DSM 13513 / CCUG 52238 / LMG 8453 / N-1) TaxID=1042878 RepID=F8GXM0_CUPNN|nr:hypothetical protein [Cupriavidus necator]AEI82090.1 hypothetical protein CNE_BB1p06700 [Cupriavidus necator N-1]MDX6008397.1 hypothetical protein [Cupriavidus necator]
MNHYTHYPDSSKVEVHVAVNVTVAFAKVQAGSELDDRIRELKTNVEAFDGFVEDGMPSDDLKRQANHVNAAYSRLSDAIEKQWKSSLADVVAKAVETAAAIMNRYSRATAARPDFGVGACERLARRTHELYANTAGRIVNEQFMWELNFYDWASRKKLLYEKHRYERRYGREERPSTSTDDELVVFFRKDEDKVLKKLIQLAEGQAGLVDPLADEDNANSYKAFKGLPQLNKQKLHSQADHDD